MVHECRLALAWRVIRFLLISGSALVTPLVARAEPPPSLDASLAGPLDRATLVRLVVARNPAVRAASQRARATETAADGEGRLPPPQVMGQVWQVPLARPYAFGDSQMIMVGVGQSFPCLLYTSRCV